MDKRFSHQNLLEFGTLEGSDFEFLRKFRGSGNKLGAAYQLIFVRLFNIFPKQKPFEVIEEIFSYALIQLSETPTLIEEYQRNSKKVRDHQKIILEYLNWSFPDKQNVEELKNHILKLSYQHEQESVLKIKADQYLRQKRLLSPSENEYTQILKEQKTGARIEMFEKIHEKLTAVIISGLDDMLKPKPKYSTVEKLKRTPKSVSTDTVNNLISRLQIIEKTGILDIDISFINNNYLRSMAGEVRRCSAAKIRGLNPEYRYSVLTAYLKSNYIETVDYTVKAFISLFNTAYTKCDNIIINKLKENKDSIIDAVTQVEQVKEILADKKIEGELLRNRLLEVFENDTADEKEKTDLNELRNGKYSNIFLMLADRYTYFRKFTPGVISSVNFIGNSKKGEQLVKAAGLLNSLNLKNKRKLPRNAPKSFLSKKTKTLLKTSGGQNKRRIWECGLYYGLKDEIKKGNINILHSKKYCSIKSFYINEISWKNRKKEFFQKSGLPEELSQVKAYLKTRLNNAYDRYFIKSKNDNYASVVNNKWKISAETDTLLSIDKEVKVKAFSEWLEKRMRTIRLPDLLLEVNNDLGFTMPFIRQPDDSKKYIDDICGIIAAIMAHGCNIGIFTMSKLTQGVSYTKLRSITDWQLTEDAVRIGISWIINAISKLDISKNWGQGFSFSADVHQKIFREKVITRHYSPRLGDYALEFLTFIADNYAPLYIKAIECTDGEAPHALDGFLYNESDLPLSEFHTDSRAAATINFGAFQWYGVKYNPRIKGLHNHNIFKIDNSYDYHELGDMLDFYGATVDTELIEHHWESMAQLYCSIETGHSTAASVMRRLLSFDTGNDFYKANLHFSRIIKTEYALEHFSDKDSRIRKRRCLLKGEQMHQLARDINYANRGKIKARDDIAQNLVSGCLNLILACIVYWQSKEISRVMNEYNYIEAGFDPSLTAHISPVEWNNIIVYGEYFMNRNLIKL
jgi:TnpA family transposase